MAVALLETAGLGKDYGERTAVGAVDLCVGEGEIFGLLGPNGAGKSTTISMICGVVTPSRGTASIAGHDIREEPFAAKRALGLVPQELALYDELSARQNLGFFASAYRLSRAELRARVGWALEVAGLCDRADEPVSRFSGGMKRRLNLAAGLLHRPRLLVLDEPTVGVDPQSRNYLFETIRDLNRAGMTIVYTSHYMEEVQALCSRVAIMDAGAVVALDRVEALTAGSAGGAFDLELEGPLDAIAGALAPLGDLDVRDRRLRIVPRGPLSEVVRAVEAAGGAVHAVRAVDRDLESVFLELTGKSLRDA